MIIGFIAGIVIGFLIGVVGAATAIVAEWHKPLSNAHGLPRW